MTSHNTPIEWTHPPASLTPHQLAALRILTAEIDRTGVAPSMRQLASLLGLAAHSGANRLLAGLERAGWVRRDRKACANLTVLHRPPAAWAIPEDQRPRLAALLRAAADRLEARPVSPDPETSS